ncbi:hypothetical protein FRX31_026982, partial [Thalictrum thalictroides]
MTSWSGQRGSKSGDLVGHGLKQKVEGSEPGARQREKWPRDMGKCTGQQSSATLGTDSSVHEAADKKGGAKQQVKVPCEGVNRQQQQVATKCRSGLIPFAQTSKKSSNYTTMFMEEHNVLRSVRSGFCVYDSMGLDYNQVDEGIDEFTEWMVDGIYHHQLCCRSEDGVFRSQASMESSKDSPLLTLGFKRRQVNYALVVANLAEIYKALMK